MTKQPIKITEKKEKNAFKYFIKHFFTFKLSNPETGKRFKCFNVSLKVLIAGFFSANLAFLVLLIFFLGALSNPARAQIRRKLKSGQNLNAVEYSLLQNTEILGHRGVREGAPENTLKAINVAHKDGAHGVEFDVRFTKDFIPILMHDPKISRTVKGNKKKKETKISNMTFKELSTFKTRGEKIPTLEEALKLIRKLDLIGNLEVKADKDIKSKEIKIILGLVNKYSDISKFSISSFDENVVTEIKKSNPEIITGYISYGVELDWLKKAKMAKADYVNFHLMGLQLNQMEKIILCKQNDFAIKTWPVNDLKTAYELISAGVDGIISDNPKVLMNRL